MQSLLTRNYLVLLPSQSRIWVRARLQDYYLLLVCLMSLSSIHFHWECPGHLKELSEDLVRWWPGLGLTATVGRDEYLCYYSSITPILLQCPERPLSLRASQARRYFTNLLVGFGFSRTCGGTQMFLHWADFTLSTWWILTTSSPDGQEDRTAIMFKTTEWLRCIVCHDHLIHCHNTTLCI